MGWNDNDDDDETIDVRAAVWTLSALLTLVFLVQQCRG